jgi:tRNA(Ile)-lysidine synthase
MVRASDLVARELRAAAARLPFVFEPGARLLVAVSGGQDSTCLLHALTRREPRLELVAAHVDHALRSDSAAGAQNVTQLAQALGVPAEVMRVDVAAYRAGLPAWSVQQAARAARYHALAHMARARAARAIVVAHTADDQAETLLLNLLRGAGFDGAMAMRMDEQLDPLVLGPSPAELEAPEKGPVRVVRPLLKVGRPMTLAYCAEFELTVLEDPSNRSRAYTRNRVRHELLPALEQFNPAIRRVLARTADLVAEDVAALEGVVAELDGRLRRESSAGLLVYDRELWRAQSRALQRRLLRRAMQHLVGTLQDVRAGPIDDALDLVASGRPGQSYHLPYGIELRLEQQVLVLDPRGRARARDNLAKNWGAEGPRV